MKREKITVSLRAGAAVATGKVAPLADDRGNEGPCEVWVGGWWGVKEARPNDGASLPRANAQRNTASVRNCDPMRAHMDAVESSGCPGLAVALGLPQLDAIMAT